MRHKGRLNNELREINISRNFLEHAEGSSLVEFGNTKVICAVSFEEKVPIFLKGKKQGWLTAEYGMLPRSTNKRMSRESSKGKQSGRTQEIQRLIGRSLRSCLDLSLLGENTLYVDCDVIQADGGTRTASITGAFVALYDAISARYNPKSNNFPIKNFIAAVSVGILGNEILLDLDYSEDSRCETDMNIVMNDLGEFIELQGTAEGIAFTPEQLNKMLSCAKNGIDELLKIQKRVL